MSSKNRGRRPWSNTGKHSPAQTYDSSDMYLAAGVEMEEAAEKWRAGDAVKSYRFYMRAIKIYDDGLHRFPDSFDLAYNNARARSQYIVTQHSSLLELSSIPLRDLLQEAVDSNNCALNLEPLNAEALFNAAQVLSSLGEHIIDFGPGGLPDGIVQNYLDDSIDMFHKCLLLQEAEYERQTAQLQAVPNMQADLDNFGFQGQVKALKENILNEWAVIEQPVTPCSLIETISAFLDVLETSCSVITTKSADRLSWIENTAQCLLEQKLHKYSNHSKNNPSNDSFDEVLQMAAIQVIKLKSAILEAQFRCTQIDVRQYDEGLSKLCEASPQLHTELLPVLFCAQADALLAFTNTIDGHGTVDIVRWSRLARALELLSEAIKIPNARDIGAMHSARGDIEMLRYGLSLKQGLPPSISSPEVQLTVLRNAETYYRGAAGWARSYATKKQEMEAKIKEAIATCLATGSNDRIPGLINRGITHMQISSVIKGMVDESLITKEILKEYTFLSELCGYKLPE